MSVSLYYLYIPSYSLFIKEITFFIFTFVDSVPSLHTDQVLRCSGDSSGDVLDGITGDVGV